MKSRLILKKSKLFLGFVGILFSLSSDAQSYYPPFRDTKVLKYDFQNSMWLPTTISVDFLNYPQDEDARVSEKLSLQKKFSEKYRKRMGITPDYLEFRDFRLNTSYFWPQFGLHAFEDGLPLPNEMEQPGLMISGVGRDLGLQNRIEIKISGLRSSTIYFIKGRVSLRISPFWCRNLFGKDQALDMFFSVWPSRQSRYVDELLVWRSTQTLNEPSSSMPWQDQWESNLQNLGALWESQQCTEDLKESQMTKLVLQDSNRAASQISNQEGEIYVYLHTRFNYEGFSLISIDRIEIAVSELIGVGLPRFE